MIHPVLGIGGVSADESRRMEYAATLLAELAGIKRPVQTIDTPGPVLLLNNRVLADSNRLRDVFEISTLQRELNTDSMNADGRFNENAISWNVLEASISRYARDIRFAIEDMNLDIPLVSRNPAVVFTHDIDRVHFGDIYSLMKIPLRHIRDDRPWISWKTCKNRNSLYETYKKILEMEMDRGIRSWTFFMASGKGWKLRHARYNPEDHRVSQWLKLAGSMGAAVGLHGSYDAPETNAYAAERKRLEAVYGKSVSIHRNHYLRMNYTSFWNQLQHAGFTLDSTVGYANRPGFRAGICQIYRPYDPMMRSGTGLYELPLVYMDRNYHLDDPDKVLAALDMVIGEVAACNGQVAVLTHPESFAVDPRWFDFYRQMIDIAASKQVSVDGTLCMRGWDG